MKTLIKTATVYKATIPCTVDVLAAHLAEKAFNEIPANSVQRASVGFVPVLDQPELTANFTGGFAFKIRYDEKTIPGAAIKREMDARIKALSYKPNKKGREDIKCEVIDDLSRVAFIKTAAITLFYHAESQLLIVPSTSKKLSDIAVSQLIHAVGAIKTETLHVSSAKKGLTTKLKNWLGHQSGEFSDGEAFGNFHPCSDAALADANNRKLTVKMSSLETASQGLTEALTAGFEVCSLGFCAQDDTEFRLTDDFKLKSISYGHGTPDAEDLFAAEATLEVASIVSITQQLLELLQYKDEEDAPAADAAE